jgi:hypothetical protein
MFAILLNASFFPFIWGGDSLMSAAREVPSAYPWGAAAARGTPETAVKLRDPQAPATQMEPAFALEHRIVGGERHLPLWNALASFGMPLAADMQSQPYFPLTALAALAPSPRVHALWVLARLFIAALLAFSYLRSFVAFWPAFGGGVLFSYTGYFLLFINIGHLSVETLLPGVFLAQEWLLRERSAARVLGLALVTALVLLGGMPESALLALGSGVLYWAWRVGALQPADRLRALRDMAVSSFAGCCLAGFLLVPFFEFVGASLNQHAGDGMVFGRSAEAFDVHAAAYIAPLLFGPMGDTVSAGTPGWFGPDGFFGVAALFLAIAGVAAALRPERDSQPFAARGIAGFFCAVVAFAMLKHFGVPPVQWLGSLPVLRLVDFLKYDEPVLGFALASLAAIGMDRLAAAGRARLVLPAVFGSLLVLTAGYAATAWIPLAASPAQAAYFTYAWSVAFVAFAALAGVCVFWNRLRGAGPVLLVAVCCCEANASYLVPAYYVATQPGRIAENPYQAPPYAEFLQRSVRDGERVMGVDGDLYPMWAAAYGLSDPENVNALYPARYLSFVRAFLSVPIPLELLDRFTGTAVRVWDTVLERRFLTLSSIAYLVTPAPLPPGVRGFDRVYAGEAYVYRVRDVLPRAAVYHLVTSVRSGDEALALLANPSFDVFRQATVEVHGAPPAGLAALGGRAAAQGARAEAAPIVSSDSEQTTIQTAAQSPGLLVYNDTNFPGWQAFVDGAPAPILDANFLFRGVLVPAGKHVVRFEYEPESLRAGYVASIAGIIILALSCRSFRSTARKLT